MTLADFVAYLDNHLEGHPHGLRGMGSALEALGRNRTFLADYLRANVGSPDFQALNPYEGPTFVLHRGAHYMIRANGWPTEATTPQLAELYTGQVAHNHTFSLLTLGYQGPGYTSMFYSCDPHAKVGEIMKYQSICTNKLEEGRVFYYPAFDAAHAMLPPEAYSTSINVIVRDEREGDQIFFDVQTGRVIRRIPRPSKWVG